MAKEKNQLDFGIDTDLDGFRSSKIFFFHFYRASAILLLTRDIDIAILSVRPSARLSVRLASVRP